MIEKINDDYRYWVYRYTLADQAEESNPDFPYTFKRLAVDEEQINIGDFQTFLKTDYYTDEESGCLIYIDSGWFYEVIWCPQPNNETIDAGDSSSGGGTTPDPGSDTSTSGGTNNDNNDTNNTTEEDPNSPIGVLGDCPKGKFKNSNDECVSLDDPCTIEGQVRNSLGDCINNCTEYNDVVEKVIDVEAGYVNDPADPGGATNRGITWGVWKKNAMSILGVSPTLENLKNLTSEQAKQIYEPLYWDKIFANDISDGDLRYMLFDFHVNSGGNAIKVLQRTLNQLGNNLMVDGAIGSQTIDAINNFDNQMELYNTFKLNRQAYYDDITERSINRYLAKHPNATEAELKLKTFKRFINGWTNRVNHFIDKTLSNSLYVNC